jgi:hypothetical protein
MNWNLAFAYFYRHDGSTYIGCRAKGENMDCYTMVDRHVDCLHCKHAEEFFKKEV